MEGVVVWAVDFLRDSGLVGAAIMAFVGLAKRLWVPGWAYTQLEQERDEWKEIAMRGIDVAERVVGRD